jgi:hypothetical protein
MRHNAVRFLHGDILDEEPGNAFPLARRGPQVAPELGKGLGECHDRLPLQRVQLSLVLALLLFGSLPRLGQGAQLGIPLCLQDIGHQSVVRIDAEIPPLREICFILCALHLELSQPHDLGSPGHQFILYGEGKRNRLGGHDLFEDSSNRSIEVPPGHPLTGGFPTGNTHALTEIVWDDPLPPTLMIAYRHALPTATAQHYALE